MAKPTIILATSNGIGMGHLARACAITESLKEFADPIIVSMAGGIAEIPAFMNVRCEYIPGRDRGWMKRDAWDVYLRDRLVALIDETGAKVLSFDGVVPYPGVIAAKMARPEIKLVWVRRGLWQKKPQRFVLGVQSKMMDLIIEPGDFARAYDHGPTSIRKDAVPSAPISMFQNATAMSRDEARKVLGLDLNRPAVLVQLGTGDGDVNEKMTAALSGLLGWKDLQVVLTKKPVDAKGNDLAPAGLDIKVVRYFPLARLLKAFDASICAAGYNGIHELLAAAIPTAFVPNIRGTDDQEMRARWCADFGYSLMADQANLEDIEVTVKKLQSAELRSALAKKCADLPLVDGGAEVAKIFINLANTTVAKRPTRSLHYLRLVIQIHINRGAKHMAYLGYHQITRVYQIFKPMVPRLNKTPVVFADSIESKKLHELIRGKARFEHLIQFASPEYRKTREAISTKAYGIPVINTPVKIFQREVLESILSDYQIQSVNDFGVGLPELLPMPGVQKYCGIVENDEHRKYQNKVHDKNETISFLRPTKWQGEQADISLSFNALSEFTDIDSYNTHVDRLFNSARQFVLIYSTETKDLPPSSSEGEILIQKKMPDYAREELFKEFRLVSKVENPLDRKEAAFFLYKRITART